jgi:hypothetical protein
LIDTQQPKFWISVLLGFGFARFGGIWVKGLKMLRSVGGRDVFATFFATFRLGAKLWIHRDRSVRIAVFLWKEKIGHESKKRC